MRGVQSLVQRTTLRIKGIVRQHDNVNELAFGRGIQIIGQPAIVAGEPDHLDLAGALQLLGHLAVGIALGPIQGVLAIFAGSETVDIKGVEIRGATRREPAIHHFEQLLGPLMRMIFRNEENVLAAFRILGEPLGENLLGLPMNIAVRRIEITNAHGPRNINIIRAERRHHAAHAQHGHLRPALAQLPARQHSPRGGGRRIRERFGRKQRWCGSQSHRERHGRLEKGTAGSIGNLFFHKVILFWSA